MKKRIRILITLAICSLVLSSGIGEGTLLSYADTSFSISEKEGNDSFFVDNIGYKILSNEPGNMGGPL